MAKVLILGGLMVDRYYFVDRIPRRGHDGIIEDSFHFVGGCAINMAVTIKNLGGTPFVVSYVGRDAMGETCLDYLREKGLPLDCVRQAADGANSTGYCMVFVEPDGERTFLTKEGCEGKFDESLIPAGVSDSCCVAAVTGYYLLGNSGSRVASLLEKLKEKGCAILFDPSPMVGYIAGDVLDRVMASADVITPNWDEAVFLAGRNASRKQGGGKAKGPEAWAEAAAGEGRKVILTRGAGGGIAFEGDGRLLYDSVPAKIVDSTGAGDSFSGALAFSLARGWSTEKAVAVSALCAALTVEIKGPHGDFDTSWAKDLKR